MNLIKPILLLILLSSCVGGTWNHQSGDNSKLDLDRNFCDCLENHLEIMQQSNGRIPMAEKHFNLRGKNGICCR